MIIAHVATIPEREQNIRKVVEDIRPQVSEINVYWNGYDEAPAWARGMTWDVLDDLGDAGKFYDHSAVGYHLTLDDDLFYPPDYVERTVEAIDQYGCPVTWHGKILDTNTWPWRSYFADSMARPFGCLHDEPETMRVHVPGSGVFGYHTDDVRIRLEAFTRYWPEGRNMADVHLGVYLKEQDVPVVALAHRKGWIAHQPIDFSKTLYRRYRRDDGMHTRLINEAGPWPVLP